jgi:diguanylate cyclase (GGDEF)-like protein
MNLVSKDFQNLDFEFNVNYLYKDKYDYIWFSNEKYGLSRVNVNSNFENKTFNNVTFKTFLVDDEGFIWIVNDNNFKLYNSFSNKWENIPLNIDEDINFIRDNNQNIFLVSDDKIFLFDKKDYSISVVQDIKERINDVLIDKDQNLWISTEEGLYYLDDDLELIISDFNITSLTNNEDFIWGISENNRIIEYNSNNKNYRIIEDDFENDFQDIIFSNEKLFISTNTNILSYDISTRTYKIIYNGYTVNNLEKDKYGSIWFSTKNGLSQFLPFEERIIQYGKSDGIYIGEKFIDSYVSQSNKIHFLSENSLTYFYVEDIKPEMTFHPLIIKTIQSNKTVYDFEEQNNYRITEDNVEIVFEYADYKDKILTRYKFNGDDEWNYTNNNSIKLSKLQQGSYEIILQTIDESKQWIGEEKNIKFSISYNFFSTNYAIFTYIILILLSFLTVVYLLIMRVTEKWNDKTKQLIRQHIEESQENSKYLEKLNKKIEELSFYDSLTGIQNLRLFDEIIEREWNLAKRKEYPLSLIIIDLDNFKNYNDEYGHLKGDEVLVKVANSLKSCLRRSTDHLFRYAGEKFAAILPDTDKPGAKVVSENMRQAIEKLNIEHKKSETADHLTVSIGTSTEIPTNKMEIDTFISEAEEALVKAKNKGKNQTIQYDDIIENDS